MLTLLAVHIVNFSAQAQVPFLAPKCADFYATPISEITDSDGIGWKYTENKTRAYRNKELFTGYTNKVCSNNWFLFSVEKYENGQLMIEAFYHYAPYGTPKLREIKKYSNGSLNGNQITYYKNGQIETETDYVDGKKDGDYFLYDEDGALIQKKVYKSDTEIECKGKYCID